MLNQFLSKKLRYITYCLFLLCSILFLNSSYSFAKKLEIISINAAINKNMESKNIFDEIYFKNSPRAPNDQITSTATIEKMECTEKRPTKEDMEVYIYIYGGSFTDFFEEQCFWSENIESISWTYDAITPLIFQVVFLLKNERIGYSFFYNVEKNFLEINYFHSDLEGKEIIDSYKFGKIPTTYYEKYNLSRDELVKTADDILYNHFLPMYFDKNKENGGVSKFSMENLGEFAVDYRF